MEAKRIVCGGKGNKFLAELKGVGIDVFYIGVTGVGGEPHVDLREGVSKDHSVQLDSEWSFTIADFGITTHPKLEYEVVAHFGSDDCTGGNAVQVSDTRRFSKQ